MIQRLSSDRTAMTALGLFFFAIAEYVSNVSDGIALFFGLSRRDGPFGEAARSAYWLQAFCCPF